MPNYKLQSPLVINNNGIYPLTTVDQVILDDNSRLNSKMVTIDLNTENDEVTKLPTRDADTLGGIPANKYALKENIPSLEPYALKSDTAPDSSKLGGKAPEYYLPAVNLLDNSDFRNPVMQSGFNSLHGSDTYVFDRWLNVVNIAATHGVDGLTIMADELNQRIKQRVKADHLIGKMLTLAVYKSDGTVVASSAVMPSDISNTSFLWTQKSNIYLILSHRVSNCLEVELSTSVGVNATIKAVALYEGSYTVETLPPYVPKGYAAELAECQRYFRCLSGDPTTSGYVASTVTNIYIVCDGYENMYDQDVSPTVTIDGDIDVICNGVYHKATMTSATFNKLKKMISVSYTSGTTPPSKTPCTIYTYNPIYISKDL